MVLERDGRILKRCIVDMVREDIADAFEVSGENDNGRRIAHLCAEMGMCMG